MTIFYFTRLLDRKQTTFYRWPQIKLLTIGPDVICELILKNVIGIFNCSDIATLF